MELRAKDDGPRGGMANKGKNFQKIQKNGGDGERAKEGEGSKWIPLAKCVHSPAGYTGHKALMPCVTHNIILGQRAYLMPVFTPRLTGHNAR